MAFRHSPAMIDAVRRLWRDGKTASECGELLGMTRNAVIGLVHRNGIKRDDATEAAHKVRVGEAALERLRQSQRERMEPPRKERPEKPVVVPKAQPFTPIEATDFWRGDFSAQSLSPDGPKLLMDLNWGDCRFPLGKFNQSPTGFCGATTKFGSSFCAAHHALVYRGTVAQIEAQRRRTEEERRRKKQREAREAVRS